MLQHKSCPDETFKVDDIQTAILCISIGEGHKGHPNVFMGDGTKIDPELVGEKYTFNLDLSKLVNQSLETVTTVSRISPSQRSSVTYELNTTVYLEDDIDFKDDNGSIIYSKTFKFIP